jgi:hypothetical protein
MELKKSTDSPGNRTREAQGPLGSGESGASTGQRCEHLACSRERRVPHGLRRQGGVRVRVWDIPNDAHSLARDGQHAPRDREPQTPTQEISTGPVTATKNGLDN